MGWAEKGGRKERPRGWCPPEVGELDATLVQGGVDPRLPQGLPVFSVEQVGVAAVGAGVAGHLRAVLEGEGAGLQEGGPMGSTRHHGAHQRLVSGQWRAIRQVPHQDQ